MSERLRVVVIEDHAIVRDGLVALLRGEPDMEVVAAYGSGEEALRGLDVDAPSLVLLDLRLPGMDGLQSLAALRARRPGLRVLMLSSQEGDEAIYRALKAGAVGYVLKRQPSGELLDAIRRGATGKAALAPEVAVALSRRMDAGEVGAREREILRAIAQGLSNKEIAEALGLSPNTVRNYIVDIMGKLGVGDRTQAVTIALQRGIIDLD